MTDKTDCLTITKPSEYSGGPVVTGSSYRYFLPKDIFGNGMVPHNGGMWLGPAMIALCSAAGRAVGLAEGEVPGECLK